MANLLITVVTVILQACVVAGYFEVIQECDYRFLTRWRHCFNGGRCARHVFHMGYDFFTGQDDVTYEIGAVCQCGGTGHHGDSCQTSGERDEWFIEGNRQFHILNRPINTAIEARTACVEIRGQLPAPKNKAESEVLANLRVSGGRFVIGVNDITTEGTWKYDLDGSVITWSYWMNWTNSWGVEPNGGARHDCAVMLNDQHRDSDVGGFVRGGWADLPCGDLADPITTVVCQRDEPLYTVLMCEDNSWINMACHYDDKPIIDVVSAFYGRKSLKKCKTDEQTDLSCASDVTDKIAAKCSGHRKCSPRISYTYLGDPCPEFNKYLEVYYRCIPATSTPSPPPTPPQPTAPGPNWIVNNTKGYRYAVFDHPVTSVIEAWQLCRSHNASLPIPHYTSEMNDLERLNATQFFLGYFFVFGHTIYSWYDILHNLGIYRGQKNKCGGQTCVVFQHTAHGSVEWSCLPCYLPDGGGHPPVPNVVCVSDDRDEQGWITKDKKQYKVFDYTVTSIAEARSLCFENGGILPEPYNTETRDLASLYVQGPFPLGISDDNPQSTWRYDSDGTDVGIFKWNPHNPNGRRRDEHCLLFGIDGGYTTPFQTPGPLTYGWEDVSCDFVDQIRDEKVQVKHLVCERPLSAAPVKGWINVGNKQYKVFQPKPNGTSFNDAQYLCHKNDAKLPEPRNQEENDNLARLPTTAFYLGMGDNTRNFYNNRRWNYSSDNTEVQFFQWMDWPNLKPEPDNEGGAEHCAYMMKTFYSYLPGHQQGGWGDVSCDLLQEFITAKPGGIVCERDGWLDNFIYANKQYRVFHPTPVMTSYAEAKSLCAEHQAILPEPQTVAENNALVSLNSTGFYLGMQRITVHNKWFWNSGPEVTGFVRWQLWSYLPDEPHNSFGNETCAIMLKDFYHQYPEQNPGGWASDRCDQLMDYASHAKGGIVCQRDDWVYDPQSHKTYKVFQPAAAITSRHYAFDLCYKHGAKLPQPLNRNENDFLGKLTSTAFYLGVSGDDDSNWWVLDGTQKRISYSKFINWDGPKDFEDITGKERCVMMLKDFYKATLATLPGFTGTDWSSYWMAVKCDELEEFHLGRQGVVVCERDWYPVGDIEYMVIRESVNSHDEAFHICFGVNGKLPEPRSQRENDIIANELNVVHQVVLGINDKSVEGWWHYDSGPAMAYQNWIHWSSGNPEPNGGGGEDCAVMSLQQQNENDPNFIRGQWLDDSCNFHETIPQVVCQRDRSPADLSTPAPLPVVG